MGKIIMKLIGEKKVVAIFLGIVLCLTNVTGVYAQTPYANEII